MSIAEPPEIEPSQDEEMHQDPNNRKCHLLRDGYPICGASVGNSGPIQGHRTLALVSPCPTCRLPRCTECVLLFGAF